MARSGRFWIILLLILAGCALVYFAGARRVPLWDRDEPWYAECSREMLQSGDWVVPRFLGDLRPEKPPLIYWCQAAVMEVAGGSAEAARFPSTIAVLATALLVAILVRRYTGGRRALWTVFIFGTCVVAVASAKFCITDGVLLLFVIIGQACLAVMYAASRRGKSAPWWLAPIFWISLGLAGITKGPQPLGEYAFTLFILLMLDVASEGRGLRNGSAWRKHIRWWGNLRPLVGIPIVILIAAPWLILIHRRAPTFIPFMLQQAKSHMVQSAEGHAKPPGYHAVLSLATFYPWSLLLPTTVIRAWKQRRSPTMRFAIAATAGPWIMMELVYTKLPFYVLPAFPGLAFLTADTLVRCIRGQYRDPKTAGFRAILIIWIIATLALSAAPWLSLLVAKPDQLPVNGFIAFSLAGAIYAALVGWRFYRQQIARAGIIMGMGMGVLLLILYIVVLPNMTFLHLPERLASDLIHFDAYGANERVLMIGYDEPSLAFYQGGGARRPPAQAAYFEVTPQNQWPRWFIIADDAEDWRNIPQRLRDKLTLRAVESGLNYSHEGKVQRVLILENTAAANR